MRLVDGVFEMLKIIVVVIDVHVLERTAGILEIRVMRRWRRLFLAQIGKNQTQHFCHRIGRDVHLVGERIGCVGLFGALPSAIILPAMVRAANAVPRHDTGR